jgi:hypothetical protein
MSKYSPEPARRNQNEWSTFLKPTRHTYSCMRLELMSRSKSMLTAKKRPFDITKYPVAQKSPPAVDSCE